MVLSPTGSQGKEEDEAERRREGTNIIKMNKKVTKEVYFYVQKNHQARRQDCRL